ncbi:putative glutaminase GtaA [Rhizoctonia solani 123E]|uniref:Putative glutaminase GtaA n=1 Tax=Rhizoctonia solani 123E TaxID=1423351 RepID=A0A074SUE3_9AGAM|nr:putative glutaminase GtaA [Rhizoctonia solani 123E]
MTLQNPSIYTESRQRAQWGALYFASNQVSGGTTWQTGQDIVVRQQFLSTDKLANTQDINFRKVSDNWPVMAFAQDLGIVTSGYTGRANFVLGHLRDPVVQYQTPTSPEARSLYSMSKFLTEEDALNFALNDWVPATKTSARFTARLIKEGEGISPDYMGVLSASTLQAFASMELTVSTATKSIQDPKLFIKDSAVQEDGSSIFTSVNSLYSIMPMFIYTNPRLGNCGLRSLLEYAKFYNQSFAAHDIGLRYGEAVVNPNRTDSTASMIIMTYAFMRYTGDAELPAYDTLKTWADYLIENALFHSPEVTGDWFVGEAAGPAGNMTNVALKGLIALRSMVEIEKYVIGKSNVSPKYLDAANSGLERWIQLSDYGTKFSYQSNTKQYLLHALYADKLLGLNFVPESVYARQRTQYTSGMKQYGVPLTDANNFTTIAHQYFTIAALTAGNSTFLGNSTFTAIKNYTGASVNANLTALADTYNADTGVAVAQTVARGNVGGAYAVLALKMGEVKSISPILAPSGNSAGKFAVFNLFVTMASLIWSLFLI